MSFHICHLSIVSLSYYWCYIILVFVSTDHNYKNYMMVETFLPEGMEEIPSSDFCAQQKLNLKKRYGCCWRSCVYTSRVHLCKIGKTNAGTRVAILCGHLCGCMKNLILIKSSWKWLLGMEKFKTLTLSFQQPA